MKYMSRPKYAAVKDIDIDSADILGQKYRYRIDIGHGDIDSPLMCSNARLPRVQCHMMLYQCRRPFWHFTVIFVVWRAVTLYTYNFTPACFLCVALASNVKIIVGPPYGPDMRCLPPSVRCPHRGHIWKSKQHRLIVTKEHCIEVGIADSVAAFRFSRRTSPCEKK